MRKSMAIWLQFSLRTVFLFGLFAALLAAWWKDRSALERRLAVLESRFNPPPFLGIPWGVEQVVGPKDTNFPGDARTAWASLTADGQDEWLLLRYARSVRPTMIEVYENHMPGAITKVTAFDENEIEHIVWTGIDPTSPSATSGVSKFPYHLTFRTNRIKLYLNSSTVVGWNEIDAVALRERWWGRQWAESAEASSSWGARYSNARQNGQIFTFHMGVTR